MAKKKHGKKKGAKTHHAHAPHKGGRKKKDTRQYVFGAVVFVVLVAVVAGLIYLASKSGEMRLQRQGDIAATVNGEPITMDYLDEQYDRVPVEYRQFITKATLLNQTINEVLLLQEADRQGVNVTQADVQAEIENAMMQAGVTPEQLDERLAEQNISREFLEELYGKQLKINALLDQTVFDKIKVTDEDVESFYDSRIHAMHILVESEDEALDIIEELKGFSLNEIETEFGSMASEKSIDPSAVQNMGDLGEFGRGQMVPAFEQAAFGLEEYAFTAEPVQTQFGYHVILRLPKEQTLEEQRASIEELIRTQKQAQAVPLYVEQLKKDANIEVLYIPEPVGEQE